jgi:hypothetical protein
MRIYPSPLGRRSVDENKAKHREEKDTKNPGIYFDRHI